MLQTRSTGFSSRNKEFMIQVATKWRHDEKRNIFGKSKPLQSLNLQGFYNTPSGALHPCSASLPVCGSPFGRLDPSAIRTSAGRFHLRRCPFGFEPLMRLYADNEKEYRMALFSLLVHHQGFEPWTP